MDLLHLQDQNQTSPLLTKAAKPTSLNSSQNSQNSGFSSTCVFNYSKLDLKHEISMLGFPSVHAATIFSRAYSSKLNSDPAKFTSGCDGLPRRLDEMLTADFFVPPLRIVDANYSAYDASVKFLCELTSDGQKIETVLMPEKARITVCLSSQVGCAQRCSFCYTGRMGLKRNLSTAEIVGQVVAVQNWMNSDAKWRSLVAKTFGAGLYTDMNSPLKVSNVVFMGMGEPLDNVDCVIRAIRIFTDPQAFAMRQKRVTVSTAGHLDGLNSLLVALPRVAVALSLHSPFSEERRKIMPIEKLWPVTSVIQALGNAKVSPLIQYTLLKGVNDSSRHAEALLELLKPLPCKVNLIPFNEVSGARFDSSDSETILSFRDMLHQAGLRTMIRYSKGQDVQGACGQLYASASTR